MQLGTRQGFAAVMSSSASSLNLTKGTGRSYGIRIVSYRKRCTMKFIGTLVGKSWFRFLGFWIKAVQLLKNRSWDAMLKREYLTMTLALCLVTQLCSTFCNPCISCCLLHCRQILYPLSHWGTSLRYLLVQSEIYLAEHTMS